MGTVLKILELMQTQVSLMGEIFELKIWLAVSTERTELRIHERDMHERVWDHAAHAAELPKQAERRTKLEKKQGELNSVISKIAQLQRELAGS